MSCGTCLSRRSSFLVAFSLLAISIVADTSAVLCIDCSSNVANNRLVGMRRSFKRMLLRASKRM